MAFEGEPDAGFCLVIWSERSGRYGARCGTTARFRVLVAWVTGVPRIPALANHTGLLAVLPVMQGLTTRTLREIVPCHQPAA